MPKEITFAIVIGFILGILIMFGIYTANKAINKQSQEVKTETSPTPSPSPTTTENFLTITEPADEELFNKPEIVVSGKTAPGAAIAFMVEDDEIFIEADEDGFFSQEIELEAGVNSIKIISTDNFGSQAEANLTLTYSTKVKLEPPSETDENE